MVAIDTPLTRTLTFTRTIKAPAEQVYSAFTDRDWIRDWLCDDAHLRVQVGGHLLLIWNPDQHVTGVYTALEANERVAFTWKSPDDAAESLVEVVLEAQDNSTALTLTHSGDSVTDAHEREWEKKLHILTAMLETGADIRITERVIIGIYPGAFDAEVAQRLGVPVEEGTRVTGLVPGLAAEQAGLQPDDVVVAMDGTAVTAQMPMNQIVADRKPGDTVEVAFYRGSEKQKVALALSGYPVPAVPETFAALGDHYQTAYGELDSEIKTIFAEVTEAQAGQSPAEGEWSANQVLAHLILSERWLQHWLGGLMQGPEVAGFTGNTPARIAGVTTTYPTSAALLAELRRAHAETVALLRAVPAEYAARKNNLWWMAFEMHGFVFHTRQHIQQINEALAAARA
ncbi:MAG: SRPBCC domain-containing protein [Anaerolineaceae bacterium]|nr:SRPBCC domain-containing protein [Anaerolineaceae bacterium]